ncbi:12589_t:CDS:2, partial [Funneliformis caledonium]
TLMEGKGDQISNDASEYFENVKPFLKDDELWKDEKNNQKKGGIEEYEATALSKSSLKSIHLFQLLIMLNHSVYLSENFDIKGNYYIGSTKRKITDDAQGNQRPRKRLLTND